MKTLNKTELIREYIEETNIVNNRNFIDINKYYYGNDYENNNIAEGFISDYFGYLANTKDLDYGYLQDWIYDIQNFDVSEASDSYVETNDYKLMLSYEAFQEWIDISERNEYSILENLQRGQFEGYYELFDTIKNDFSNFLEGKLELLEDEEY